MKYYIVSDIHGYYTELKLALDEKGFFSDTIPHKLIVCGDVLDRGSEAKEVQHFILDLMDKNEIVLMNLFGFLIILLNYSSETGSSATSSAAGASSGKSARMLSAIFCVSQFISVIRASTS